MPKSDGYVSADYLRKTAEIARYLKERTYELMEAGPGDSVLDVGCGPGLDTIPLAVRVGDTGRAVGLDIDEEMLSQADRYAKEQGVSAWVSHRKGDVSALPFADATFDSLRAERLFQVLPATYDADSVLDEMIRVIKSGGRLVLADADWATASVDFPDASLERRLLAFFARAHASQRLCRPAVLSNAPREKIP